MDALRAGAFPQLRPLGGRSAYREIGVGVVTLALDCSSVWLMESDVRGRPRVTEWDREGGSPRRRDDVARSLQALLGSLPVLRPVVDDDGAIVLTVRASGSRLVGWRLVGRTHYSGLDRERAARLVPVLADPEMLEDTDRRSMVTRVLTTREAEILTLVSEGMTARAIARRCGISVRTVQKHLEQAYRKLDCHDRLSAVLLARDSGLLRLDEPVSAR